MTAPKGPGRPPLGRSVRLGSVRMTEATAAQWEALRRPGESLSDAFARLVAFAAVAAAAGAAWTSSESFVEGVSDGA